MQRNEYEGRLHELGGRLSAAEAKAKAAAAARQASEVPRWAAMADLSALSDPAGAPAALRTPPPSGGPPSRPPTSDSVSSGHFHTQLLHELHGLKAKVMTVETPGASGTSTPATEPSTAAAAAVAQVVAHGQAANAAPHAPRAGAAAPFAGHTHTPAGATDPDKVTRLALALATEDPATQAEAGGGAGTSPGGPSRLSSRIVDLVQTLNKIAPEVWTRTAQQAALSNTRELDRLLAREAAVEHEAAAEHVASRGALVREAFRMARRA